MDAFFARNRLSAYLDGALSEVEAAEVERALSQDPALKADYEQLRQTVDLLKRQGPASAPAGFHAAVMARVAAEPAPRRAPWLRRVFSRAPVEAIALAATAMIVVLAIQNLPGKDAPEPRPAPLTLAPAPLPEPLATDEAEAPPPAVATETRGAAKEPAHPARKDAPPSTTHRAVTGSSGAAPPEEPYVADWEREGGADAPFESSSKAEEQSSRAGAVMSSGVAVQSAYYYRVTLASADSLMRLASLAEQLGGRLEDRSGARIAPYMLTDDQNYADVKLILPQGQSAAAIDLLRSLGATAVSPPASAPLYGADNVIFKVELLYRP